ncbi:MAG: TspO/MBR family protein [Chloroflexota bacterium]
MDNSADRRSDLLVAVAPLVAGTAIGVATNSGGQWWYRLLSKPSWTPPAWVFGPVWTVLYLLQGIALVQVLRAGRRRADDRKVNVFGTEHDLAEVSPTDTEIGAPSRAADRVRPAVAAFGLQFALNLAWSVIFFGQRAPKWAALELAGLLAALWATFFAFARVRLSAALLLLPYLAWSTFAGLLNVDVVRRNPRA